MTTQDVHARRKGILLEKSKANLKRTDADGARRDRGVSKIQDSDFYRFFSLLTPRAAHVLGEKTTNAEVLGNVRKQRPRPRHGTRGRAPRVCARSFLFSDPVLPVSVETERRRATNPASGRRPFDATPRLRGPPPRSPSGPARRPRSSARARTAITVAAATLARPPPSHPPRPQA